MNYRKLSIASALIFSISLIANPLRAQTMDVDQADTIDFQSFHKDKKEAVKVWDSKSNTPTKTYSDQPAASTTSSTTPATPAANAAAATAAVAVPASNAATAATTEEIRGKRFELRERYTLTRSAKTPYSAFYVIEPLYKQAAQLCPKGWRKLTERSEPIEQDYYLYYEIECL